MKWSHVVFSIVQQVFVLVILIPSQYPVVKVDSSSTKRLKSHTISRNTAIITGTSHFDQASPCSIKISTKLTQNYHISALEHHHLLTFCLPISSKIASFRCILPLSHEPVLFISNAKCTCKRAISEDDEQKNKEEEERT